MKALNLSVFAFIASVLTVSQSHATYALAAKPAAVVCWGEDSMEITVNTKRTSMKVTVEGEGGAKRVSSQTDGKSYVSYRNEIGTLTLSDAADTFQYADGPNEEAFEVKCH